MATTSELPPTRLGRSSSFESGLASGTASTSSSQKNSPERERGGLVNRPSDSSISSLTASQGRQFRRVFSRQSFSGPVDAISWEAIVEEARQMVERDEFLAIVVRQKVLRHASFAEALVDSLASVFHSATIPAADWAKLFASVYQDDIVYEVRPRANQPTLLPCAPSLTSLPTELLSLAHSFRRTTTCSGQRRWDCST